MSRQVFGKERHRYIVKRSCKAITKRISELQLVATNGDFSKENGEALKKIVEALHTANVDLKQFIRHVDSQKKKGEEW